MPSKWRRPLATSAHRWHRLKYLFNFIKNLIFINLFKNNCNLCNWLKKTIKTDPYDPERFVRRYRCARPKCESLDRNRPSPGDLSRLGVYRPSELNRVSGMPFQSFYKVFLSVFLEAFASLKKLFFLWKSRTWIIEVDSISHSAVVPSPEAVMSWLSEWGNWQCD